MDNTASSDLATTVSLDQNIVDDIVSILTDKEREQGFICDTTVLEQTEDRNADEIVQIDTMTNTVVCAT